MKKTASGFTAVVLVTMLFMCELAAAQQSQPAAANSAEDLQKATQNPVASLISFPFRTTATSASVLMTARKMC